MIFLQADLVFSDEPEIIYKGCYKTKDILFSHGLQFPVLDTIIGSTIRFVECLLIARQIT